MLISNKNNGQKTAEGVYKTEHDSIRLKKWLAYYDRFFMRR